MSAFGWAVRGAVFGFGALVMLGGLVGAGTGTAEAISALVGVGFGAALMIGAVLERTRYRSEAADRSNDSPGPGGGESDPVEPRFRPTDEVFVDPTTGRRMRVLIDPRTGERRYVAEA